MFQFVSEQIALPLLVRHETSLLPLPVVCVYLCCGRGVGHAPLSPQAKKSTEEMGQEVVPDPSPSNINKTLTCQFSSSQPDPIGKTQRAQLVLVSSN